MTLRLKPTARHSKVTIGIGAPGNLQIGPSNYRQLAKGQQKGYVLFKFPTETGLTAPTERSYDVVYGRGNRFKGGERVEVYSLWGKGDHMWGMSRFGAIGKQVVLPAP